MTWQPAPVASGLVPGYSRPMLSCPGIHHDHFHVCTPSSQILRNNALPVDPASSMSTSSPNSVSSELGAAPSAAISLRICEPYLRTYSRYQPSLAKVSNVCGSCTSLRSSSSIKDVKSDPFRSDRKKRSVVSKKARCCSALSASRRDWAERKVGFSGSCGAAMEISYRNPRCVSNDRASPALSTCISSCFCSVSSRSPSP